SLLFSRLSRSRPYARCVRFFGSLSVLSAIARCLCCFRLAFAWARDILASLDCIGFSAYLPFRLAQRAHSLQHVWHLTRCLDSVATGMAGLHSRDRDAFMAHWARIMSNETNETGILNTILADDTVAGNVVYWEAAGEPNIGYWLGKTHWGKGIASAALAQF